MLNTQQLQSIQYFLNKSQLMGNEATNLAILQQEIEQEIKFQQQTLKVAKEATNPKKENGK